MSEEGGLIDAGASPVAVPGETAVPPEAGGPAGSRPPAGGVSSAATRPVGTIRTSTASAGRLTAGPALFLLLLCAIWGANAVAIKYSNRGFPPVFAAGVRSVGAAALLVGYAALRGRRLWPDRVLLPHALAVGVLFAGEFLFLYVGLAYTSASRAIVLLYTMPLWAALGAHYLFPDDRMTRSKVMGLVLSFGGIIAVFGAGGGGLEPRHWVGDIMEIAGAVFWAATTLYVKRMSSSAGGRLRVGAVQVLFFQLLFSAPVLLGVSLIFEAGRSSIEWRLDSVLSLLHQTVVVATLSYLGWFWLIERYRVSTVSSFTFVTPLFGVIAGGILLSEPLPGLLWVGMAMVAAGIYLVNRVGGPTTPRA